MVWLPLTTAFLQVQITLYRTKTSLKPAMSQLSEPNALSSWATIAYVWKTLLQRFSIFWSSQFPIVVNSWSDYRWPPRFCKCKSRCIEQKRAKNLPHRSRRRPVLYPAELWSHILRKRHADMFRREKKPAFCTENKPLLTGYILCVRLAVERTKAGAKPL